MYFGACFTLGSLHYPCQYSVLMLVYFLHNQLTKTMNDSKVLCETNWVMNPEASRNSIILLSIQSFLILVTLFVNAIEVMVVWGAEECVGTKKAILLSLCISDFLHGLITQVAYTVFLVFQLYGRTICFLANACMSSCLFFTHASILSLWLASAERYLCIIHPFVHERYLHSSLWVVTVVLVWCVAVLVTVIHRFYFEGGLTLAVFILIACVGIGLMYVRIAIIVIKARKEIRQQHASVGNVDEGKRRSAMVFAVLVVLTIICYAPFSYCVLLTKLGTPAQSQKLAVNWLWCLLTVSSVLNPICYCLMNRTLRRKCLKLLKISHNPNLL